MKGKKKFSALEAVEIENLLEWRMDMISPNEKMSVGNRLREIGFFVSDFRDYREKSRKQFSKDEFTGLIRAGLIEVH